MKKILISIFAAVLLYVPYIQAELPLNDTKPTLITPRSLYPVYPMESSKKGEEGTVLVELTVSKTGEASNVSLKKSSGHLALDKSALSFVNKLKFNPATRNGQLIESKLIFPINFRLHG